VAGTETYFVTRTDVLSCRNYYAAKKSFWTSTCNLGKGNCTGLWTRVSFPYGTSTGEQAADAIAYGFVGTLAAIAVPEYFAANRLQVALAFIQTVVDCPDCVTGEDFAAKFSQNLLTDVALGGIFSSISASERAQFVAKYIGNFSQTSLLRLGAVLKELKIKYLIGYEVVKQRISNYFVSGITRRAYYGFKYLFYAEADEILAASTRIKAWRITNGWAGNYSYMEGKLYGTGVSIDNKIWSSGVRTSSEPQIFEALNVTGGAGNVWLRNTDSEYKMLNKLASDLGGFKNTSIYGELKIISENMYCASCRGIIGQFHEMFPNIKLILIDGAK
jgi:The  BURPS668_1122 family of deaminases